MKRGPTPSLGSALAALALASGPAAAGAEPLSEPARRPTGAREPGGVSLSAWTSLRAGVVDAPYPSATLGEVRSEAGQARLFRLGGALRVAENAWVGAHAAYVFGGVEQAAGSYRAASAWGNPMLFGRLSRPDFVRVAGATIDGDLALSLGIPVAAERGNPYEQLDRRTLAMGNALEGMMDPEVFTPDNLPGALGGSLVLSAEHFQLSLSLELPFLLRLSDDTIPDGASSSALGFVPNVEAHAAAWPWTWLGLSLGGMLAWPVVEPVYLASRSGDPQTTLVPRLLFALGRAVLITLDGSVAAGGPSAGTASVALGARLAL